MKSFYDDALRSASHFASRSFFLFLVSASFCFLPAIANGPHLLFSNKDSQMGQAVICSLVVVLLNDLLSRREYKPTGRAIGSKTRYRERANLHRIFDEYGPIFFKRAYRMQESSFWKLLDLLETKMPKKPRGKKTRGRTPNGDVPNSVRLAMAIRYFAGGDPLDIACVYKVNRSVVYESVWSIVEVINHTTALDIKYPTQHAEQRAIANEFKAKSAVGFNNCAGCLDGLLIWTHKPSDVELKQLKIGGKKY